MPWSTRTATSQAPDAVDREVERHDHGRLSRLPAMTAGRRPRRSMCRADPGPDQQGGHRGGRRRSRPITTSLAPRSLSRRGRWTNMKKDMPLQQVDRAGQHEGGGEEACAAPRGMGHGPGSVSVPASIPARPPRPGHLAKTRLRDAKTRQPDRLTSAGARRIHSRHLLPRKQEPGEAAPADRSRKGDGRADLETRQTAAGPASGPRPESMGSCRSRKAPAAADLRGARPGGCPERGALARGCAGWKALRGPEGAAASAKASSGSRLFRGLASPPCRLSRGQPWARLPVRWPHSHSPGGKPHGDERRPAPGLQRPDRPRVLRRLRLPGDGRLPGGRQPRRLLATGCRSSTKRRSSTPTSSSTSCSSGASGRTSPPSPSRGRPSPRWRRCSSRPWSTSRR